MSSLVESAREFTQTSIRICSADGIPGGGEFASIAAGYTNSSGWMARSGTGLIAVARR